MLIFMVQPRRFQDTKIHLDFKETLITIKFLLIRVGPDVRQRRIIRSDIRYLARKSRIIRHIQQGMPDNPAGYPASGKKTRSGPTLLVIPKQEQELHSAYSIRNAIQVVI